MKSRSRTAAKADLAHEKIVSWALIPIVGPKIMVADNKYQKYDDNRKYKRYVSQTDMYQ